MHAGPRRTLSGVPSCASESSCVGWVQVAVLSSTNEFGRTLIGICAPRDACVSTPGTSTTCYEIVYCIGLSYIKEVLNTN